MPKTTTESKELAPAALQPPDQMFREFDHAMHDMERRMDRLMRDTFGKEGLSFPLVQGLLLQPGSDGRLQIQPFGHIQESLDRFVGSIRQPALSWTLEPGGKAVEFRAEVPGLKKTDIEVKVLPNGISIEGRNKTTHYSAHCEPGLRLDTDGSEARCEDGILTVHCKLREPAEARSQRVEVK